MILNLYRELEKLALSHSSDIVKDSEVIYSPAGRARKLRLYLIDETFIDIWYNMDKDYSYHWEQRNVRDKVYRHDNAPHHKWRKIPTFPKHCHDRAENIVVKSTLPDDPKDALVEFLSLVRKRLIELKQSKR